MNRICRTEKQEEASRGGTGELPTKPVATIPQSAFCVPQSRASALITTLLVLVVLSTIVVAFMQSMSVERSVARSAKNRMSAELAAQAGLDAAISQIRFVVGTNTAFVTGQTNYSISNGTVTIIGRSDLTNLTQLMPLVSSAVDVSGFGTGAWTSQLLQVYASLTNASSLNLNTDEEFIQVGASTNTYRSAWVELTNSFGETNGRYAYVVVDDQARVNPLLHTGTTGMTNATNWYQGSTDISLSNAGGVILDTTQMSNIATAASFVVSDGSLAQSLVSRTNFAVVKHLLTTARNPTVDVIPGSLAAGGLAKYNINRIVTNVSSYGSLSTNSASAIAEVVSTNIPSFGSRDPSLRGSSANELRYVLRLAANIVDYIDADSNPTYVNNGEPAGRDLFPLVTAIASQYTRSAFNGASDPSTATIESRIFVQVWNPYTSPVSLNNTPIRFIQKNRLRVNFGSGIVTPFNDYDQSTNVSATIQPNEFTVIEFPMVSQTWSSPGPTTTNTPYWGTLPSTVNTTSTRDQTTWMPFEFYINGQLVDMNRRSPVGSGVSGNTAHSGLTHNFKNFNSSSIHYQVNFVPTQSSAPTWRFVGDPRATFLSNYDWGTPISADASYGSSTRWKGRQDTIGSRSQDFFANWVNRDFVRANASLGNTPGSTATTPAQVASAYNAAADGPAAIAVLRNGPMLSVGELGNVFDPIQAADDLAAPTGGTPGSPYVAAGGRSLRVGQTDFSVASANTWNTNGRKAIELVDLFTVNETNSSSASYPTAIGRVNINTASPEVLAAILASVRITSDSGVSTRSLTNIASISALIASNRPYSKLSDLASVVGAFGVSTNYSPAFVSSVGGGTTNIEALDRVREEAFGKLVQHFTVQSRTFRVFVIGEVLDRGKVRGRVVAESLVYLPPSAPGGRSVPVVQWSRLIK